MEDEALKIHILGSCSGTEPMPGRHHTAWILETDGRLYQFDAGENCAWTAHTTGIDVTALRALFISHPHFDHTAGLPHLLWTRLKIHHYHKIPLLEEALPIFTPEPEQWAHLSELMVWLRSKPAPVFKAERVVDGEVFDDGAIRVDACHNRHLKVPENGVWRSFSYSIAAEGKRIVYSGDLKEAAELDGWLASGSDLVLMESGHLHPWETAAHIREVAGERVRKLVFMHHGRDYLDRPEETAELTRLAWGEPVVFADDAMTFEI